MRTKETIAVNTAVAITEEALRTLHVRLEELVAENAAREPDRTFSIQYSGELVGGAEVEFNSFDELMNFPNRPDRRLSSLRIMTAPSYAETAVSVVIGWPGSTVLTATASGEDGHALRAKDFLKDFAAAVRAPYRWMYVNWGVILFITFVAFYLALNVYVAYWAPETPQASQTSSKGAPIVTVWIAALVGFLAALYFLRGYFFPRTVFAIGQRRAHYEGLKKWQWLPVAAFAGLVAKILYDKLI